MENCISLTTHREMEQNLLNEKMNLQQQLNFVTQDYSNVSCHNSLLHVQLASASETHKTTQKTLDNAYAELNTAKKNIGQLEVSPSPHPHLKSTSLQVNQC